MTNELDSPRRDEKSKEHDISRLLTFTALGCYVVGLLIVNLELARHGIWEVELGKPEYILVGALWMILTGLGVVWFPLALMIIVWCLRDIHPTLGPWYRIPGVIVGLVILIVLIGFAEVLLFGALIWAPLTIASGVGQPIENNDPRESTEPFLSGFLLRCYSPISGSPVGNGLGLAKRTGTL